MGLAYKIYCS